jgi:hypothetical protein
MQVSGYAPPMTTPEDKHTETEPDPDADPDMKTSGAQTQPDQAEGDDTPATQE